MGDRAAVCCCLTCVFLVLASIAGIVAAIVVDARKPRYYAAITSASGLDPATDLGHHAALDPEFNLTLRVASRKPLSRACIEVGSVLDVSYRGVRLAGAPAPHLCSGKGKSAQVGPVLVWGTGIRLPGSVLDSLAADLRAGTAAFDVALTVPSLTSPDEYGDSRQGQLVRCLARRVGDEGVLRTPCYMHHVDAAVVASQQGT